MKKKKFAATALNLENETFIEYITSFANPNLSIGIYLFCRTLIIVLFAKKTFTVIFTKYTEFANIFSTKNVAILLKYIRVKNYTIELIKY